MRTWTDHDGRAWPVPRIRGRLRFGKVKLHARLRDFVLRRDGFCCTVCGASGFAPGQPPRGVMLVADHVVSRRNGGEHHPDNLRATCESCNARKANTVDRRGAV